MRSLLICSLAILLANCIQAADVFKNEKVRLGKRTCTCTFTMETKGNKCAGQAKCDKKCTGNGAVEVGDYSFTLAVKKGKGKIAKCTVAVMPTVGPVEPTGSGSGPVEPTGSGSGSGPVEPTGSGSGPPPPTGSGSGEVPVPMGEGMPCSCRCNCPDGAEQCDCDCNCPMMSTSVSCASGFTRVCPMMSDVCPTDTMMMCPNGGMPPAAGRMMHGSSGSSGCQCVPDFLMALVHHAMPAATRMEATDRAKDVFKNEKVKLGKRTCTCTFTMETKGSKCAGQAKCDNKCTGNGAVEVGDYSFTLAVKKGKGKISKCTVAAMPTVGPVEPTGSGSGPAPTGSGTGPMPPTGSGSGMERCTCVGNGGSGPTPPTGSGSGPNPPTGTGSGSGSSGTTAAPIPNPGAAAYDTTLSISQTWSQEPSGYERTAKVSVPTTTAGQKVPVVVHLHGNGGQGNTQTLAKWLGDDCVIVSADGYERSWNIYTEKSKADDVSFILDLIAKVGTDIPAADMNNVNIIGTSNGAALTYSLMIWTGSDRPFRRAFPMVSSLISPQYHDGSFWKFPVSAAPGEANDFNTAVVPTFADDFEYAHFHGTEDGAIKYDGQSPGPGFLGGADVIAAQKTDFLWAQAMGYTGSQLDDSAGVSVGTTDKPVEEYTYLDGKVRHFKLVGEGHGTGPGHTVVQEIVRKAILG